MRRSITATLATAAIIATGAAAVAVPLTDATNTGASDTNVRSEDDPLDPINPTPRPPADPLAGETPTPGVPDQGTPGADAVDPGTPPPSPAPDPAPADPGVGEQPSPGNTDTNVPQDSAGQADDPAPTEPEATPSPAPTEPRVDTSTVTDIAPGSYIEGEAATDTGYEVVRTYRPGVQLAKTGADGTILAALVAILLGGVGIAGAAFARRHRASTR